MADNAIQAPFTEMESPFTLSEDAEKQLEACDTLRAVRDHLSTDPANFFCASHSTLPLASQSTWLLHRDILHALTVPITTLYHSCAVLASSALCSSRPEDLELAYRGDARSAFLALQCIVHEEVEWCTTRGCPACISLHTLSSEAILRLAITATLLAKVSEGDSAAPLSSFLPALQRATEADPFWGPSFWTYHYSKALSLRSAIHALINQASDLSSLVSSPRRGLSPSPSGPPKKSQTVPLELCTRSSDEEEDSSLPRLKASPLAKQQMRLDEEQRALLRRAAWQMYNAVATTGGERKGVRAASLSK